MTIDTNDKSIWLEREESQKLTLHLNKKIDEVAPMIYANKIKACKKSLNVKKITDLSNGDNLRNDQVLSILHHNCKAEHDLIISGYSWLDYHDGNHIDVTNNNRMSEAGDYSYELDQIAKIKKLPKGTVIYEIEHEHKTKNLFTFFYILDDKPVTIFLRCMGSKGRVIETSPYHNFIYDLGQKFFDDDKWFERASL